MKSGLSTLGSGGTSGLIPNYELFPPEIHDNPDYNLGHGLGYGQYEYDIFAKTGRKDEAAAITDWIQEDIDINRKFQELQVPTIPGHPAGGGPWLLNKDWIGDFDKKLHVSEIPGHIPEVKPVVSSAVRDEFKEMQQYNTLRNAMKSPDYIENKIRDQMVEKKNMQGSRANRHIEKMKEEIKADKRISGPEMMDLAVKRDSTIVY